MLNKYRSSEEKKPGQILLSKVTFKRGDRKILDNISLKIPTGKIVAGWVEWHWKKHFNEIDDRRTKTRFGQGHIQRC